jgi:hypothetical protein
MAHRDNRSTIEWSPARVIYGGCSRSDDFPGGTGARDLVHDGVNYLFLGLLGFFLALRGVNK